MQYPGYTTGKVILSEGEWLPFIIHNLVKLQDDEWYYVLQDVNGLKHFLNAQYYENYGFKPGDEILCKIDKINCTGRIYLEPKHPYYTEGEMYDFELINQSDLIDKINFIVKGFAESRFEISAFNFNTESTRAAKKVRWMIPKRSQSQEMAIFT